MKRSIVFRVAMIAIAVVVIFSVALLAYLFVFVETIPVTIHGERDMVVQAEVADSTLKQVVGLMFRTHLDEDSGMIFSYDNAAIRSFWMRNTRIPLDIIFLDSNRKILNVEQGEPCKTSHCRRYRSVGPARFVLEINRNVGQSLGLKPGDEIEF
jgi:uncharacterized membrane protein (UPF0127 family)